MPPSVRAANTPAGDTPREGDGVAIALNPQSIAVIGASDQPHRIGGRPLFYLRRFGFSGRIYAVNPNRQTVQGLRSYPDVAALPETPDVAIVVTPAEQVAPAVEACAARGVRAAIVMTSGFGETLAPDAIALERRMAEAARAAGMRLVGPNSQGLANFGNGAVASFSTIYLDPSIRDGPVALVAQSGMMSAVPMTLLARARIGVRYSLATGNEADVTAGELVGAALEDESVRLVLLYLEAIRDPDALGLAAARARDRDVPIVAVKAGRSARGATAARTHTAALACDDHAADAFLRHCGIWRVTDIHELVRAAPLYLKGWRPAGRRLVVVSSSGGSCVMAADTAQDLGVPLAQFDDQTVSAVAATLPSFATASNPVDVTAALMHDGSTLGRVLEAIEPRVAADLFAIDLPVCGEGYDLGAIVGGVARFAERSGRAVAASTPHRAAADAFLDAGVPAFENPTDALKALVQIADHAALVRRSRDASNAPARRGHAVHELSAPTGTGGCLNEVESLAWLHDAGVPVVAHRLCRSEAEARDAFAVLGPRVAVKGCSREVPHKARAGLVALNVTSEAEVVRLYHAQLATLVSIGARVDGVIVARMEPAVREVALGIVRDPHFGPLVMIGSGGGAVETREPLFLMPPFTAADVHDALARRDLWRPALARQDLQRPTLTREATPAANGRGAEADFAALAAVTVDLGALALALDSRIASIDLNPVLVGGIGSGVLAADAVIELEDHPAHAHLAVQARQEST